MKCVICGKEMEKEETKAKPHDVCVKCFWVEAKKQANKKYVPKFNLLAVSVGGKQ